MLIVYYYRTVSQAVLDAFKADEMAVARIEATAEAFAERFGARPYFTVGFDSHFAGIGFDADHPCYHPDLWSKPTPDNPCQVPRSPERAGSKMKDIATKLYTEYHTHFPKEAAEPRVSALLAQVGLGGKDMSKQLMVYHEVQGAAYIACSLELPLEETTASVFVTAQRMATASMKPLSLKESMQMGLQ